MNRIEGQILGEFCFVFVSYLSRHTLLLGGLSVSLDHLLHPACHCTEVQSHAAFGDGGRTGATQPPAFLHWVLQLS